MAINRLTELVNRFRRTSGGAAGDASTTLLKIGSWLATHAPSGLADNVRTLFTETAEHVRQQGSALTQVSKAMETLSAKLSDARAATTVRLTEAGKNDRTLAKPAADLDSPAAPTKAADSATAHEGGRPQISVGR